MRYEYKIMKELPTVLEDNIIYLEGENKKVWTCAFKCPCGCNDIVYLNLIKNVEPCWKIKFHWFNKLSIYPSIRKIVGCKSHFIIKRGEVSWCYDDYYYRW